MHELSLREVKETKEKRINVTYKIKRYKSIVMVDFEKQRKENENF